MEVFISLFCEKYCRFNVWSYFAAKTLSHKVNYKSLWLRLKKGEKKKIFAPMCLRGYTYKILFITKPL